MSAQYSVFEQNDDIAGEIVLCEDLVIEQGKEY